MKCNRCNGNGKYKTIFGNTIICDFCYGTGEITYGDDDRIEPIGNKKPMTNFEWLTESPERLAEWLACKQKFLYIPETNYEAWMQWLKEIHR